MSANKMNIETLIENNHKAIVIISFLIFLLIGMCIFKDYGVGWDEGNNRHYGYLVLNYILGDKHETEQIIDPLISDRSKRFIYYKPWDDIPDYWDPVTGRFAKTHGPAFEVPLVSIEKFLNLRDSQKIYFLRHIATFLMFYLGVFFFYILCKHVFKNWKTGLLGSLFLVLSPRIFSHSFHNSMDITFLSMFIVSMYTLVRYLEKKNIFWAILHAISCAIMINIRIAGIIVPVLTFTFATSDTLIFNFKKSKPYKTISTFLVYFLFLGIFTILPRLFLWKNPINNFIAALKTPVNVPWDGCELYLGEMVEGGRIPWHFIPAWMLITTPPIYTFFFLTGLFSLIKSIRDPKNFYPRRRAVLIAMLCFFLPLTAVPLLKLTLYNGWRHMFFIYPGFLILSLAGVLSVFGVIKKRFKGLGRNIVNGVFILAIVSSLTSTAFFMIKSHPHQNVYFNNLVGGLQNAKGKFEIGYWGTELREGLEYILKNDSREKINIYATWDPVWFNAKILAPSNRKRIEFTEEIDEADYFLSNYYNHPDEYEFKEIWSREIDGVKIITVYKLKNDKPI